jgi:hypothetical protein
MFPTVTHRQRHGRCQQNIRSGVEETDRLDRSSSTPSAAPPKGRPPASGSGNDAARASSIIEQPKTGQTRPQRSPDEPPVKPAWPEKRPFLPVLLDKTLDTVEDVALHARRSLLPLPTRERLQKLLVPGARGRLRFQAKKPIILVLGSGWGAHRRGVAHYMPIAPHPQKTMLLHCLSL